MLPRATAVDRRDWESTDADTSGDASGREDDDVRFAVVGLGGYARAVSLPAVAAGDYTTVGAVVSGDREKAQQIAGEYDAVGLTYEEYAAGGAADAYDAVYIATPNREHLPHVETAASHGKHALVEKPLDATAARAQQAVNVCHEAGVELMTAYRMQTDPVIRRVREAVADGVFGEPVKLFGDFTFPVLAGSRGPDQWRLDGDLAGGGALYDVGVYPLNTARFLLDADPVAVSATAVGGGGTVADTTSASGDDTTGDTVDDAGSEAGAATDGENSQSAAGPFDEVDEHTHFHVEFPGGVVGNFSASFTGHSTTFLELVGTAGRGRIADAFGPGDDRRVTVETDEGRVRLGGAGADETREEFDYFAHAILTGREVEPDGRDGVTDLRVLETIVEAAEAGERRVVA